MLGGREGARRDRSLCSVVLATAGRLFSSLSLLSARPGEALLGRGPATVPGMVFDLWSLSYSNTVQLVEGCGGGPAGAREAQRRTGSDRFLECYRNSIVFRGPPPVDDSSGSEREREADSDGGRGGGTAGVRSREREDSFFSLSCHQAGAVPPCLMMLGSLLFSYETAEWQIFSPFVLSESIGILICALSGSTTARTGFGGRWRLLDGGCSGRVAPQNALWTDGRVRCLADCGDTRAAQDGQLIRYPTVYQTTLSLQYPQRAPKTAPVAEAEAAPETTSVFKAGPRPLTVTIKLSRSQAETNSF